MKKIISVILLTGLLSGCWTPYTTPRPPSLRASVTTVANRVCVMVQPEENEYIRAITIQEVGAEKSGLDKTNLKIPVSADKCVNDFDYGFKIGKAYNLTVVLESPPKQGITPGIRMFNAGFTLWDKNGEWEVTTLY